MKYLRFLLGVYKLFLCRLFGHLLKNLVTIYNSDITIPWRGWGGDGSLIWVGKIPVPDIKVPCYFCGKFCESRGNTARWPKIGAPKYQKFPVNPCILLYGVRRRIFLHRHKNQMPLAGILFL